MTTAPVSVDSAPPVDMAAIQTWMTRLIGDLSSAMICTLCLVGDRLGLFKTLAVLGPSTSAELAHGAGVDERYAREWLRALAAAGYLTYTPSADRFTLPQELAGALAFEGTPMFMGGAYQQITGLMEPMAALLEAFRSGGGVPEVAYGEMLRDGMDRTSAGWFDHLLAQVWIPCAPEVQRQLVEGAAVADIGCGRGRALINLAGAFRNSRFVGFDTYLPAIERATASARAAGVSDRVRFECRDVVDGLPGQYDVITAFDMLHDVREPGQVLQAVRHALRPGGSLLVSELRSADTVQGNLGPVGTILYGTSLLYCLPTSRANGAPGLGTLGLPETQLRTLVESAGFAHVQRLPVDHPFNVLYRIQ